MTGVSHSGDPLGYRRKHPAPFPNLSRRQAVHTLDRTLRLRMIRWCQSNEHRTGSNTASVPATRQSAVRLGLLAVAGLLVIALPLAIGFHPRHRVRSGDHTAITVSEHVRATLVDSMVNVPPAKPDAEILLKIPADIFLRMRAPTWRRAPTNPPQFDAILFPSGFELERTNPPGEPSLRIGPTTYAPVGRTQFTRPPTIGRAPTTTSAGSSKRPPRRVDRAAFTSTPSSAAAKRAATCKRSTPTSPGGALSNGPTQSPSSATVDFARTAVAAHVLNHAARGAVRNMRVQLFHWTAITPPDRSERSVESCLSSVKNSARQFRR